MEERPRESKTINKINTVPTRNKEDPEGTPIHTMQQDQTKIIVTKRASDFTA